MSRLLSSEVFWAIRHPYLMFMYRHLKNAQVGEYVFSDWTHSFENNSKKKLIGIVGMNNIKAFPGKRLLLIALPKLEDKLNYYQAKELANKCNTQGSGWYNWRLIRRSDCIRIRANFLELEKSFGRSLLDIFFWTSTRMYNSPNNYAIRLCDCLCYPYNPNSKHYYLFVLRM